MPYLGSAPTTSFQTLAKQDFTTSATSSYTLSNSVTSANDIALFINNVRQEPTFAYSVSGTALTLTAATTSSDDMYCVYLGRAVGTINPASGSVGLGELSATGTKDATTFLRGDNTFATPSISGAYESALLHVEDQKTSGTTGGQSSGTNVLFARDLNTVVTNEITGASLSSNQITLPSGSYYIHAESPYAKTNIVKAYLYNVTDSSKEIIGTSEYNNQGVFSQNKATVVGRFTISAQKVFELQMFVGASNSQNLGVASSISSEVEKYTVVKIWKVA